MVNNNPKKNNLWHAPLTAYLMEDHTPEWPWDSCLTSVKPTPHVEEMGPPPKWGLMKEEEEEEEEEEWTR